MIVCNLYLKVSLAKSLRGGWPHCIQSGLSKLDDSILLISRWLEIRKLRIKWIMVQSEPWRCPVSSRLRFHWSWSCLQTSASPLHVASSRSLHCMIVFFFFWFFDLNHRSVFWWLLRVGPQELDFFDPKCKYLDFEMWTIIFTYIQHHPYLMTSLNQLSIINFLSFFFF